MMALYKKIGCLFLLFFVAGCTSLGPSRVKIDRVYYNDIVQETDNEQLLKNIVRLRYFQTTTYLAVTNVTASYNMTNAITATNVSENASATNLAWSSLGVTPSISYSDSPTISYMPVNDAGFIRSLQEPISFADFILLSKETPLEQALLLVFMTNKVGNLDGRPHLLNGVIIESSEYDNYCLFMSVLTEMFMQKEVELNAGMVNEKPALVLSFKKGYQNTPNARTLKKMLGLDLNSQDIIFLEKPQYISFKNKGNLLVQSDFENQSRNVTSIQMRSMNQIMGMLARGVDMPQVDIEKHLAAPIQDSQGNLYNIDPRLKKLFTIYSSNTEPMDNVFIKTYLNHHWFYIKNSDANSKIAFAMLVRTLTLVASVNNNSNGPALTLPIG